MSLTSCKAPMLCAMQLSSSRSFTFFSRILIFSSGLQGAQTRNIILSCFLIMQAFLHKMHKAKLLKSLILTEKDNLTTHVSSFFASSGGAGPLDWPRGSKLEPIKHKTENSLTRMTS